MRYKIILSYSGADFCGWQRQPSEPSVQEALETALRTLLRAEISVTGAGRTDTGVNAVGYAAHFDADEGLDCAQICYKLNAILPDSVAVQSVSEASGDFHARFDATRREYTYFLHRVKDPFVENYSYLFAYPELDVDAMNRAAALLLGRRDFSCFEKTGGDNKTSICTVHEAHWGFYTPAHIAAAGGDTEAGSEGKYLYFKISADRFLRNMVRAIVGTLLEVGRGKRIVESIEGLLLSGDRCASGQSVPGHALFLTSVQY